MRTWTSEGLALPSRSDVKPVAGHAALVAAAQSARPSQFAPAPAKVIDNANSSGLTRGLLERKQDNFPRRVPGVGATATDAPLRAASFSLPPRVPPPAGRGWFTRVA